MCSLKPNTHTTCYYYCLRSINQTAGPSNFAFYVVFNLLSLSLSFSIFFFVGAKKKKTNDHTMKSPALENVAHDPCVVRSIVNKNPPPKRPH